MSRPSNVVLGLDGGGTKTVCVAVAQLPAGESAEPVARVVAESTNWNSVGVEQARANLRQAVERTLQAAGTTKTGVDAICLGISGVDRPEDHARMKHWLDELLPGVPALIHNDAVIALSSGTGGELYGIVLISGTGMIAMGFNRDGERRRAGGWGPLLGDGGSGYAIGAAVLRAVTFAADCRGPQTSLTRLTLDTLGLDRVDQLVRWTYDDISWHRIAELAPLAIRESAAGDAEARRILHDAAVDLALAVESVARRLKLHKEPFPLVFAGGGLRPGLLADGVRARLRRTLPAADVLFAPVEPAIGAALLALRHIGEGASSA